MFTYKKYNIYRAIIMMIGFLASIVMIAKTYNYFVAKWNIFAVIAAYIVIAIIGIVISGHSSDVKFSFTGFLMVVAPAGVVFKILLRKVSDGLVTHVLIMSIVTVIILAVISYDRPHVFEDHKEVMFAAFIIFIVIELLGSATWYKAGNIIDSIVSVALSMYIVSNWINSQKYEPTLDAAVDSCVELYINPIDCIKRMIRKE